MTAAPGGPTEGWMDGVDGARLRTRLWVTPRPRAGALLAHGLGEHAGRYDHVAAALNAVGVGVFGWDHRGHGGSSGRRGHVERFDQLLADMDLARDTAEGALGLPIRLVVGHSMGGLLTLAWTLSRRPDLAGLVLSGPWLGTARWVPGVVKALARVVSRFLPGARVGSGNRPDFLTSDPVMQAAYRADPLVHGRISVRLFTEAEAAQRRVLSDPGGLKPPCLFLVPGSDRLADAATTLGYAARLAPGQATVVRLPGYQHESFNERGRAEVIERTCAWVSDRL